MRAHKDLDNALRKSVENTGAILEAHKRLSTADGYSLSSLAVNFAVAEAVDGVLLIYGTVPKSLFKTRAPYWTD